MAARPHGSDAAAFLQSAWEQRGGVSLALLPASWLFGAGTWVRRRLFARGALETHRLPVPVVVVGNLVVGGAGKTPATMAIVELLRSAGRTPGIVSRGYGRAGDDVELVMHDSDAAAVGDEPLLMRRRTGAPVTVGRDRVAAAHALLAHAPEVDVIVSDDGLQHLALDRDVEILVFDERGVGNGRLLPAGPLRERLPARVGPHQLVLYNAQAPTTALPGFVSERRFAGVVPLAAWWRGERPADNSIGPLHGRDLLAVAGLARPQRFFDMLRASGLSVRELALGDHHAFASLPWPSSTGDVIVTEKDAVKLKPARAMNARVWVAALDFAPEAAFGPALTALLPQPGPRATTEN